MFRKLRHLFSSPRRSYSMYQHGYYTDPRTLSPEAAEQRAAEEAEFTQRTIWNRLRNLQEEPTTALGAIFPRGESILRRGKEKPLRSLRLEDPLLGYEGLAEVLHAWSSAPISKQQDKPAQLQERLKALTKTARQIERGEFEGPHNTRSQVQDTEAMLALDRLLTLNKGSGDAQKLHRVELFMKAARADHKVAHAATHVREEDSLRSSIESAAHGFNAGIAKCLVSHQGRHTVIHHEPPPPVITDSGIYATIDGILGSDKSYQSKWQSLRALAERVNDESYVAYSAPSHVFPDGLNHKLRELLQKCEKAPLTTETRVALMQEALVKFRPAAEYANSKAATEQWFKESETKAHQEAAEGESSTAPYIREYRYPAGHEPRWYQKPGVDKKLFGAVMGAGPLLIGAAYAMKPEIPAYDPNSVESVSTSFDGQGHARDQQERWRAQMDAEDARMVDAAGIRAGMAPSAKSEDAPYRPREYRDDSVPIDIPEFSPIAYGSPEERDYQRCLQREDISGCVSPDIKLMQEEAARKYGGGSKSATLPDEVGSLDMANTPTPATIISGDGSARDVARIGTDLSEQNR